MDSSQGIPVEYKLDAFNMLRTGTALCHPKIGYVNATLLFRKRQLALNSPLGHFNGDQRMPSPQVTRHTKLHGDIQSSIPTTATCLSSKCNEHNPSHVRRHTLPSQPSQLLITQFCLNTARVLQHQKQTQYSMLQIKTLSSNIFRPSPSYFIILPLFTLKT